MDPIRAFLAAAALAVFGLPALAAQAEDRMVTSEGIVVATPNVETLNCAQISDVLQALDEAAYRGLEPLTETHPDWKIYQYEDKLSHAQFFNCNAGGGLSDPGAAFQGGFQLN